MTWNPNASRRVRRLRRRLKDAWDKGTIAAVLIAIVAIIIVWARVTGR